MSRYSPQDATLSDKKDIRPWSVLSIPWKRVSQNVGDRGWNLEARRISMEFFRIVVLDFTWERVSVHKISICKVANLSHIDGCNGNMMFVLALSPRGDTGRSDLKEHGFQWYPCSLATEVK